MATVIVVLERDGSELRAGSLALLRSLRPSASDLGATLYAVLPGCRDEQDRWITQAGEAGADKIILMGSSCPASSWTWDEVGSEFIELCDEFRPRLLLFAHSRNSSEVAPRLASHLDALLVQGAVLRDGSARCLILDELDGERRHLRSVYASEMGAPVVATLYPPEAAAARGLDDADVIFFEREEEQSPTRSELVDSEVIPLPLESASLIVCAGAGARAHLPLVDELARLMGARRASTLSLYREGLAHEDEVVDLAHQCVAPRIYLCCGASGSKEHLSAIAPQTTIVCLDRNPCSPLMQAAQYGLLGELSETLPDLISQLRGPE